MINKEKLFEQHSQVRRLKKRGLPDGAELAFSFFVSSDKDGALLGFKKALEKLFENIIITVTEENSGLFKKRIAKLTCKIDYGTFGELKDEEFFLFIGWLWAFCGDHYCTLGSCGLII